MYIHIQIYRFCISNLVTRFLKCIYFDHRKWRLTRELDIPNMAAGF